MDLDELFKPIPKDVLATLSAGDLNTLVKSQGRVIEDLYREVTLLKNQREDLKQRSFNLDKEYITVKSQVSGTDLSRKPETNKKAKKPKKKKQKVQLPSERYPNAEVVEQEIILNELPTCSCCNAKMIFSGMHETSEYLTVTPATFRVTKQMRQKYRCTGCHGDIKTAPKLPRIAQGSSYSDSMIIDVAVSKYCDLIPIERYATIAGRNGLINLPANSLIQLTHYLADFIKPIYDKIKEDLLNVQVLHADETPHRMLEKAGLTKNGTRKSWYLWGFSNSSVGSYFEIHNTRSGKVCSDLLKESRCEYLVSDVFSGYNKSVRETNEYRQDNNQAPIRNIYCNAHAYRKFKDLNNDEFDDIKLLYKKIYKLERIAQRRPTPERLLKVRSLMTQFFIKIKQLSLERIMSYSRKSKEAAAMNYFTKYYDQFTAFINLPMVPVDNNPQERQMRSPVVGRKTWYGNHSLKGARTTAILFSIMESCKLAGVNPRKYLKNLVDSKHFDQPLKTPQEFADQ